MTDKMYGVEVVVMAACGAGSSTIADNISTLLADAGYDVQLNHNAECDPTSWENNRSNREELVKEHTKIRVSSKYMARSN